MTRNTRALVGAGALALTGALVLSGCGGSAFDDTGDAGGGDGEGDLTSSDDALNLLIGSSGEAETDAVEEAVAAWSEESGIDAEVNVATDLPQQLSQGFAAGAPPDLFYLGPEALAGYAGNGSLCRVRRRAREQGRLLPVARRELHPRRRVLLRPQGLLDARHSIINKGLWDAAGLTDDDIPTTWEELATVAQTLTKDGVVGLGFGWEWQRIGTFMAQAGGGLVKDGTAIANSQENVDALTYVKDQMTAGTFAYAQDVGAGWGGEAFGKRLTAMTIEGNWITGAMTNDYPDVEYVVAELPEGPRVRARCSSRTAWAWRPTAATRKPPSISPSTSRAPSSSSPSRRRSESCRRSSRQPTSGRVTTPTWLRSSRARNTPRAYRPTTAPPTSSPTSTPNSRA